MEFVVSVGYQVAKTVLGRLGLGHVLKFLRFVAGILFGMIVSKDTIAPTQEGASVNKSAFVVFIESLWESIKLTIRGLAVALASAYVFFMLCSFGALMINNDYDLKYQINLGIYQTCNEGFYRQNALSYTDIQRSSPIECTRATQWLERHTPLTWAFVYALENIRWCGTTSCMEAISSVSGLVWDFIIRPAITLSGIVLLAIIGFNFFTVKSVRTRPRRNLEPTADETGTVNGSNGIGATAAAATATRDDRNDDDDDDEQGLILRRPASKGDTPRTTNNTRPKLKRLTGNTTNVDLTGKE